MNEVKQVADFIDSISIGLIVFSVIVGLVSIKYLWELVLWFKSKFKGWETPAQREEREYRETLNNTLDDVKKELASLSSMKDILSDVNSISADLELFKNNQALTSEAIKMLLADKVIFLSERAIRNGKISLSQLTFIKKIFSLYVAMGDGNANTQTLYEKVLTLEITFDN